MQQKNEKTKLLAKEFGRALKKFRTEKYGASINKFAFENDLDKGNISRLENGLIDIKLTTLWKVAQALNMSPSELLKYVENSLPEGFRIE